MNRFKDWKNAEPQSTNGYDAQQAWDFQQAKIDEAIFDLQHIEDAMWAEQVEHVLMVLRGSPCDTP